eukprot:jgi/Undpi1/13196/HiC_scaffold_8.g02858.m1
MLSHAKAGLTCYPGVAARALRRKPAPCPTWRPAASISSIFRSLSNTQALSAASAVVGTSVEQRCVAAVGGQGCTQAWRENSQGGGARSSLRWGAWGAAAATAALAADITADNQAAAAAVGYPSPDGGVVAADAPVVRRELPVGQHAVADAIQIAFPAVVHIEVCKPSAVLSGTYDPPVPVSTGSGFVITPDGLVVTNAHVVERVGKGRIFAVFYGGDKLKAKVLAMDKTADLAVVQLEVPPGRRLPVAEIGRSSTLRAGEFVVAMGSPMGLVETCTLGIVSSVARRKSDLLANEKSNANPGGDTFIQTDAAISTGNSGGPLIDLAGKVVGINTLKLANAEGVAWAIPIDRAWRIIEQLRTSGRVDRPQLGMRLVTVDAREAKDTGVMILGVTAGGPAERAGLRFGDLIKEVNGKTVLKTPEVLHIIGGEVGRAIRIAVQREGQSAPHTVTVVTESDLPRPTSDEKSGADSSSPEEAPASGGEELSGQAAGEDVTGA